MIYADTDSFVEAKWDFILARPATPLLSQLRVEAGRVFDEVFGVVRKPATVQRAVLVATAEASKFTRVVELHGSIDNDDIIQEVVDLLEGGAEAFEARRKRYRGRAGVSL